MSLDVDPLAEFERERARARRRAIFVTAGVVIVIATVGAIVATRMHTALPAVDDIQLENARRVFDAIGNEPPSVQRGLAAQALTELEGRRLPLPYLRAFHEVVALPSGGMRDMALARALDDPAIVADLTRACPSGPAAIASAISLDRSQSAQFFCRACDALCQRLGGTPANANAAAVAVAALAADHLDRFGSLDPVEQRALWLVASSDGE